MKDYISISCTPYAEDCVQVGEENYAKRAKEECRRFLKLIRKKLGPEPEGAQLKIRGFPHDFGTYYEVACEYNDFEFPQSIDYAYACESDGPQTWDDTTPVTITPSQPEDLSESPETYENNFIDRF